MQNTPGHRARKLLCIGSTCLLFVGVLLGLLQLVASPIASHYTRQALRRLPGYEASFAAVHVAIWKLAYEIEDVRILESPVTESRDPVAAVGYFQARLLWSELLRGNVVGEVQIERPRIVWTLTAPIQTEIKQKSAQAERRSHIENPERVGTFLTALAPFKLSHLALHDGVFVLRDKQHPTHPEIRLSSMAMSLDNFANRHRLSEGSPATFNMQALLQKSGRLKLAMNMDPMAKDLKLDMVASLKGLQLSDLNDTANAQADLQFPQGELDMSVKMAIAQRKIRGTISPTLKDVKIDTLSPNFIPQLRAGIANAGVQFLSTPQEGHEELATTVVVTGNLNQPKTELVPTVIELIINAFVEGLVTAYNELTEARAPPAKG